MRDIKFRAWDGRTMFNVAVLAISECTWACPDYGKRGMSIPYQPSVKLMQYTGLKDSKGVEVYDGDILKVKNRIFKVNYSDYAAAFTVTTIDNIYCTVLNISNLKAYEVIGNIYENPELLENTKVEGDK